MSMLLLVCPAFDIETTWNKSQYREIFEDPLGIHIFKQFGLLTRQALQADDAASAPSPTQVREVWDV